MQKIKILYVITKLELGGAQKQLLSLIRNLDKEKFDIFLFTAQEGILSSEAESITYLKIKKSRFLKRPINPFKDLLTLVEIYLFIKENKIHIVHTHSSKAGILGRFAARLAKAEVIFHTVHGWSFNDYQSGFLRWLYINIERFCAQFSHRLIVVSEYDEEKGLNIRIGSKDKYVLIRYGINLAEFAIKDQNIKKELGINNSDLVVGMVSCFKPQKSPQDFIRLASLVNKALPNVKFLLVGDGILRLEIERLILKLNLPKQVILTGWRRDIPRILSAMDIFVLTSLWEGLPISVLEAMAASKPVISTRTGGVAEVIMEGETGFLVAPRDIKKMADRLIVLIKDEDLRMQMGQDARHSLDFNFSLTNMIRESQNLYEELMKIKGAIYAN